MTPAAINFEMTDVLISRAIREDRVASLRELLKPRDLLFITASTALFAWAIASGAHWIWWFAGVPAALLAAIGVFWLVLYFLLPWQARRRMAHLPHRNIEVRLDDAGIAFQTATERLEVVWSEVRDLRRRPGFWIVCLRAGAEIPLPVASIPADVAGMIEARVPGPMQEKK
jgi:hypothetical protein